MQVENFVIRDPILRGISGVTDLPQNLEQVAARCKKCMFYGATETGMTKPIEEDPISWLLISLYSIRSSFGSIGDS